MTRMLRLFAGVGASFAMLGTLFVTHLPGPSAVGVSEEDPGRLAVRAIWSAFGRAAHRLPPVPQLFDPLRSDKTIHVAIYVVPAALWALSLGRRLPRRAGALLLACALWGALDEGSQALAGRDGQLGDWVANVVGAALGIALAWPVALVVSGLGDGLRRRRSASGSGPQAAAHGAPTASSQRPAGPGNPAEP